MQQYNYKEMIKSNLWDNNVVFAQMLALCPLLAVTNGATNGLGLGLITTAVLFFSSLLISLIRSFLTPQIRIPIFVLLIASLVTIADLAMNAWLHDLHKVLGLFIPLIVTNCAILGRAESYASKNPCLPAIVDGLATGLGFTVALLVLGGCRELIGSGTLFANASVLLGKSFSIIELTPFPAYKGLLLAILPAGGFIMLGFILAGKRIFDQWRAPQAPPIIAVSNDFSCHVK
ncbi:electron transport complex subunit E [Psychromonas antarctica]|uniref:electron transport complex subunit E n=1 Tax=Psychromonas antarctica TaxID=67573 RepID=UPI001EE910CE|nr:electron transport complex subunit E [Psychromonas antarctica]MCG6200823.1 electron transport complex subunit E [Psychromonas antarctica]